MSRMTGRIFLVMFFLFVSTYLMFSHPGDANALWSKTFGTSWDETGNIVPATGGGYYLSMISINPSGGSERYHLFSKLDSSGAVQWTKKIYIADYDTLVISELEAGSIFVQGETRTISTGPTDIVLAKFTIDSSGNFTPAFQKKFSGSGNDSMIFRSSESGQILGTGTTQSGSDQDMWLMNVNPSTGNPALNKVFHYSSDNSAPDLLEISGGYIFSASIANALSGGDDILVAKLDSSFAPVWAKVYGGTGVNNVEIHKISGENYLLVGTTKDTNPLLFATDIIVIKIDGSGNILWGKKYASSDIKDAQLVFENTDGSLILSGAIGGITDLSTFQSHILLMELTSGGDIAWQKKLKMSDSDLGVFTRQNDGTYLLSGSTFSISTSDFNILFGKFDSNFNKQWLRAFGGSGREIGLFFEASGQYSLPGGGTDSFGAGGMDAFAIILDSNGAYPGCSYINDITLTEEGTSLIASDLLWTPNSVTLTERTAPSSSDVTLNVFNDTIATADICAGTLEAGNLLVTPATDFSSSGNQGGPFSPVSKDYTLQNTGGSSISWTASKTQSWVTLSNSGGPLAAGATTTVTVSINSGANSLTAGSLSDTVTFTNTTNHNGDTTRNLGLTVNAVGGALTVTPATDFSFSGNQGGPFSPVSEDYTLQNTGGSSISWTASKTQSWVTLSNSGGPLAAGATATVTVSINSGANSLTAGSLSDTVTFTNTTNHNGDTTRNLGLTVNAVGGALTVTPATDFSFSGNQGGPFSPVSEDYTLQNTGGSSISWTASKTQSWVTLSNSGGTLAAGATTTVTVSINSGANSLTAGSLSDTVTFTNTTNHNGDTARSVNLKVNPAPETHSTAKVSASPMSVNFGNVKLGGTSAKTITIKNTGTSDLVISNVSITGSNASEFIQTNNCTTIAKGESCTITVTFNPILLPFSQKSAIVSIASNDPKKPTVNVKVLGNAPPPKISTSPRSVNFGDVKLGGMSAKTITIKNTGTSDLVISNVSIISSNASEFIQTNNCTTIAKGESCTSTVTFAPTSVGKKSAIISISSNDPKNPTFNLLSGNGK